MFRALEAADKNSSIADFPAGAWGGRLSELKQILAGFTTPTTAESHPLPPLPVGEVAADLASGARSLEATCDVAIATALRDDFRGCAVNDCTLPLPSLAGALVGLERLPNVSRLHLPAALEACLHGVDVPIATNNINDCSAGIDEKSPYETLTLGQVPYHWDLLDVLRFMVLLVKLENPALSEEVVASTITRVRAHTAKQRTGKARGGVTELRKCGLWFADLQGPHAAPVAAALLAMRDRVIASKNALFVAPRPGVFAEWLAVRDATVERVVRDSQIDLKTFKRGLNPIAIEKARKQIRYEQHVGVIGDHRSSHHNTMTSDHFFLSGLELATFLTFDAKP